MKFISRWSVYEAKDKGNETHVPGIEPFFIGVVSRLHSLCLKNGIIKFENQLNSLRLE